MPGWTNADNKFGPTKWMVGPTLGDGVNYTSIQTAVNDAFASLVGNDHADVYIRPGIYTADTIINLPGSVNLIGTSMSGELDQSAIASVHVIADIIATGNAQTICSGIFFIATGASTNDNFVLADAGGGNAALKLINCSLQSTGQNVVLGSGAGGGILEAQDCTFEASGRCIVVPTGSVSARYQIYSSELTSTADGCFYMDASGGGHNGAIIQCTCQAAASNTISFDTNAASFILSLYNSTLTAPGVACIVSQNAGTCFSFNNTFDPGGNSEYITGPLDYRYCDDHIVGGKLSSGIDNAATQTIAGWRPWAESDLNGTTVTRGTCAFDSTQFNVVEGYVQGNFSGLFPWIDQNASTTVLVNQGNFATASITLTLPSPASQGDVCKFKVAGVGATLIIQAAGGQTIQFGSSTSSVGGTLTSTSLGDAVELTFYFAASQWIANSAMGNWTTA